MTILFSSNFSAKPSNSAETLTIKLHKVFQEPYFWICVPQFLLVAQIQNFPQKMTFQQFSKYLNYFGVIRGENHEFGFYELSIIQL